MSHSLARPLTPIISLWPSIWWIDIVGKGKVIVRSGRNRLFHEVYRGRGLATIIETRIIKFVYDTIFFQYGMPAKIVSDNRMQFDNRRFTKFSKITKWKKVSHQ